MQSMHTLITKIQPEDETPEDWAKSTIVPMYIVYTKQSPAQKNKQALDHTAFQKVTIK